jgi:hypothetical protein
MPSYHEAHQQAMRGELPSPTLRFPASNPPEAEKLKGETMHAPIICNKKGFYKASPLLLALLLTACNTGKAAPSYDNFAKGLNNFFLDHPDCLLPNARFPLETNDKDEMKRMDSLVKATLLDKALDPGVHTARYTPSPAGARYAPHFCYGHREVVSIDSSSPLQVSNGFKTTLVTYHYKMQDVPVWAQTHDVQTAFPAMALAASGQATAKATLAQTQVGWQVPD